MSSETSPPIPVGVPPDEAERTHRWQTRLQIALPLYAVAFGVLLLAGGVIGISLWRPQSGQISMVADVMVTVCMLLPLVVCMLPVYLLFMVAAFGMGTLNQMSAHQLRRLNDLSRTVTEKTITATQAADEQVLNARVRLAGLEKAMDDAFDKVSEEIKDATD